MIKDKKIAVIMPAYNAEKTIKKTYIEVINEKIVDLIIIVDDSSSDKTAEICHELRDLKLLKTIIYQHEKNLGYGGNQKSCYKIALEEDMDIIIMIHPDYQYTPKLIPAMAGLLSSEIYHCILASRVLGSPQCIKGGMPLWRYIINRLATAFQNILLGCYLSEYHTGYRAYSKKLLCELDLSEYDNGFLFDNQILSAIIWNKIPIGEISCPTHYHPEASSINLRNCIKYGLGCFKTTILFRLSKMKLIKSHLFR